MEEEDFMLFDTHAHYDDERFLDDQEEVFQKIFSHGISYVLNVSAAPGSISSTLKLAAKYPCVYAAVGLHPHYANEFNENIFEQIRNAASHEKVVAIGEMGLDYHYGFSPKEVQKEVFKQQIALAKELKLPIVIHNRESTQDVLTILKETHAGDVGGVFHCFSDDLKTAETLIDMGFYLSFGGVITFKKADDLRAVIPQISFEKILIETDAPYLAPVPYRGKRNDSSYMIKVAEQIAVLKNIAIEEVAEQTTQNAKVLFKI